MTVKMAQKWYKNSPKRAQKGLKMGSKGHQNDPKMMPKIRQNDPIVTPMWLRIDPKMVQNHAKMVQNGPMMVLFWFQNGPMMSLCNSRKGQKWLKKGSKEGSKRAKNRIWTFIKFFKDTQDPSRRTHLLHTSIGWNVHFDPCLSKTSVLVPRTGLAFAQFCRFLVNFGENLGMFAFPCLILLNFAVNFAKHH